MKRQPKGFTLIELIMVIVILGILSAFALPRFADFGTSARQATLEGAAGSVRSAASIARSQVLVGGLSGSTITLDGTVIQMTPGLSSSFPTATSAGIGAAAQLSDDFVFSNSSGSGTETQISLKDSTNCEFTYNESGGQVSSLGTCE